MPLLADLGVVKQLAQVFAYFEGIWILWVLHHEIAQWINDPNGLEQFGLIACWEVFTSQKCI
jgi:hypothetical protein